MKRFLSILLTLTIIFMSFITVMAADTSASVMYDNAVSFLRSLNIMYPERDIPENPVTRGDFALYLGRALKMEENLQAESRYFNDLEMGGYATSIINELVELGAVSQNEDKTFRPNDQITKNEALKMILWVLGYGDYCEVTGGFPLGYTRAAYDIELYIQNDLLTVSDAAKAIYDAMKTPLYMVTGYDDELEIRNPDYEKTILTVYWGMDVKEGPLVASYLGACREHSPAEDNRIRVGDTWYDLADGVDPDGYLASYVRIFLDKTTKAVWLIEEINRQEAITLDVEYFLGKSDTKVEYYDESGNKKAISVNKPYIIYNGIPLTTAVDTTLNALKKGTLTIKDSNNDDIYDVIIIDDYSTFVVSAVDLNLEKLYNELDSTDIINIKDFENVRIETASGSLTELSAITKGNVLSVAKSKNKEILKIIIEDNIAEGVLNQIKSESGEYELTIDENTYEVDDVYASVYQTTLRDGLSLGVKYTYVKDSFGNLVYLKSLDANTGVIGFLIDVTERGVFNKEVIVKMLTPDNKVQDFILDERIEVDGSDFRDVDQAQFESLIDDTGYTSGEIAQLVRYVAAEDKISVIDTREYADGLEDEYNTLTATFNNLETERWFNANRLGINGITNSKTVAYCIPYDLASASDEDFRVCANTEILASNGFFTADTYRLQTRPGIAKAVVVRYPDARIFKNYKYNAKTFLINEISGGLDENGREVTVISGFENGAAVEYKVKPSDVSLSGLEKGDLVKFNYDIHGNPVKSTDIPTGYTMLYDKSVGGMPNSSVWKGMTDAGGNPTGRSLYTSVTTAQYEYYNADFQLSFGFVNDAYGSVVAWGWNDAQTVSETADTSNKPIIVIEENDGITKVYKGSIEDIQGYETTSQNPSRIICHAYSNTIRAFYVYK